MFVFTVLSVLKNDDESCSLFSTLIDGGIITKLCLYSGGQNEDSLDMSDAPTTSEAFRKLISVMYRGFSLAAWCLKLRRGVALESLILKGLALTGNMDSDGNSILHYAVIYGDVHIVRTVVDKLKDVGALDFEKINYAGYTPAMEGARSGDDSHFQTTKLLIKLGANARLALRGKFWGWILALARSREKTHKNSALVGDAQYFSFEPDPEPDIEMLYKLFCRRPNSG